MRTVKSIKNVSVMLSTQIITLILSFVSRTIFIQSLGKEYLGLNGLFSNILNTISITEMGIGTAIVYNLYKPIAQNDTEQIKSLLAFYRKCYFSVGIVFISIGCVLIPFLPSLINGEISVPVNIVQVYLCFLFNSAITYFFAHKRTIIDETQNKYLTNAIDFIGKTTISIVQIFILIQFKNYMAFLYTQILGTLIFSLIILIVANKKFPYIKEKATVLSKETVKKIWSNISILFLHKIGVAITLSSDFIIISAFIGLSEVGIFSNYALIINMVVIFVNLFVSGADASIGNAIVTLNKEDLYTVFKRISFLIFCISGFSTVCLLNLLNPFIELWLNKSFVLSFPIVLVMSINFFFLQNCILVIAFRQNAGIFRPDMYRPIIEIIFKLGLSIFLVQYYGILGVVIGTIANTFFVCIGTDAYIAHKYVFKRSVLIYAKTYIIQVLALLCAFAISFYINSFINLFTLKCVVSISISIFVYFLFFHKTREFKYFVELAKKYLTKN